MTKKYVLTGGPGCGKTSLFNQLYGKGFFMIDEVAEYLIASELNKNGNCLPWVDLNKFQERVLDKQIEFEKSIPSEYEAAILDRSKIDGIAFYRSSGLSPPRKLIQEAKDSRYDLVFFFDKLPREIYAKNQIRRETFEESERIHDEIKRAYESFGYNLINVPLMPIQDRAEFVLDFINQSSKPDLSSSYDSANSNHHKLEEELLLVK
jgi:predicted ATPase